MTNRSIKKHLILTVAAATCTFAQAPQAVTNSTFAQLPLVFEPNVGQSDPQVRFLTRNQGMTVFFTDSEAVMVLHRSANGDHREAQQAVVRMRLMGATVPSETQGLDKLPGTSNYFVGNDRSAWHTDIPQYGRVQHKGVYPGVDLVYYGNNQKLEYDFVVAPDANPNQVQLSWDGVDAVNLNADGDLVLKTPLGDLVQKKPRVYQDTPSGRVEIASNYLLSPHRQVTFALARYDHERPLVIDPQIVYTAFLGGTSGEFGLAIAVDSCGYAYVTGNTGSANFPGAFVNGPNNPGKNQVLSDVFVTKFSMTGSSTVYSAIFGGGGNDFGTGIAVNAAGEAYVTGYTNSLSQFPANQFPQVAAIQGPSSGQWSAFVTKLNSAGNGLAFSTYLGGNGTDSGNAIALDSAGDAYVTGVTTSTNFPVAGAYQSTIGSSAKDAFVTKLTSSGAMVYSTYLGGTDEDAGNGIAVDSSGSAYVTGYTYSANFPTTASSLHPSQYGGADAFVTKLSPSGNSLVYSTYLGGTGSDRAYAIAVDSTGAAYVTGSTQSVNFPTQGAFQPSLNLNGDAFLTKLSAAGNTLVYSTYLGGSGWEQGNAIAVDASGNAYVAGNASSDMLGQTPSTGGQNAFVLKMSPTGNVLDYMTFLGGAGEEDGNGIALDPNGAAYVAGTTYSTAFTSNSGTITDPNVFVVKVTDTTPPSLQAATLVSPTPGGITGGSCVIFVWNTSAQALSYELDITALGMNPQTFTVMGPSIQVCGLPTNGALVNVTLKTNFPCFTTSVQYTFTGALQFIFPGTVAVMQSPAPGSNFATLLNFISVPFTWSAGSSAASYKLDVGTWPGIGDLFSQNTGLTTHATVWPIAVPAKIYVRLTTFLTGGGQVYYDYVYTTSKGVKKL